ncbi:MAG: autotransporter domain-containing protein [Pseudomonadota bacterium]
MKFLKSFAATLLSFQLWSSALFALQILVFVPGSVQKTHAQTTSSQCNGFNLLQTVTSSFISSSFTFAAFDVITFNFTLQPGGSAGVSFLGDTRTRANSGAAPQQFIERFTVPNTGATSVSSFLFDVFAGPAVGFTGTCTAAGGGGTGGNANLGTAIAQVDGTLPVTNRETIDGQIDYGQPSVDDVFSQEDPGEFTDEDFDVVANDANNNEANQPPGPVFEQENNENAIPGTPEEETAVIRQEGCNKCKDEVADIRFDLALAENQLEDTRNRAEFSVEQLKKKIRDQTFSSLSLLGIDHEKLSESMDSTAAEFFQSGKFISDTGVILERGDGDDTQSSVVQRAGLSSSDVSALQAEAEKEIQQTISDKNIARLEKEIDETPSEAKKFIYALDKRFARNADIVDRHNKYLRQVEELRKAMKLNEEYYSNPEDVVQKRFLEKLSKAVFEKQLDDFARKNDPETKELERLQAQIAKLKLELQKKEEECERRCQKQLPDEQSSLPLYNQHYARTNAAQHGTAYSAPISASTNATHAINGATNIPRPSQHSQSSYGFTVSGEGRHVNASLDLREWRNSRAARNASYAARLNTSHALGIADNLINDPKFNLFASASVSFGENDAGGVGQESTAYSVSGGFSYLVRPDLNLGLAARFGEAEIDSNVSDIDTTTWGLAAFAQAQLETNRGKLNLEAIAAWSRSNIDSVFNNASVITTADAVTTAFSAQVKASTQIKLDSVTLSPNASITYVETDRDAFALSDGQVAPGLGTNIWLYSLGASFGFAPFEFADLTLSPGFGLGIAGRIDESSDINLSTSASLGIKGQNNIAGSLSAGYSGFDRDTSSLSFSVSVTVPLN